jgi:hypothetical protein
MRFIGNKEKNKTNNNKRRNHCKKGRKPNR